VRRDAGAFAQRPPVPPRAGVNLPVWAAQRSAVQPPIRRDSTPRTPPAAGQWSQWEVIWQRQASRRAINMP
jgi:hypothetical protein